MQYVLGQEKEVEGTLSVQPQSNPVKGFEEYFLNLNVQNNTRNPWFIGKFTICISTINCIAENLFAVQILMHQKMTRIILCL